jgi:glycosyltransferase involved in cell wall biosynthesis
MLRILPSLRAAFDVHLAALRSGGALEAELDADLPVHRIESLQWVTAAWRLRRLLADIQPDAVLGFQEAANVPLLLAVRLLGRSARPVVAVSTQSAPSVVLADAKPTTRWRASTAMRRLYPSADCLVAASAGVARDLAAVAPAAAGRIRSIYNAGIDPSVTARAAEPWTHPYLSESGALLVACGRLTEQKDYPTLLGAVVELRRHRDVRLIVLGDGPLRATLDRLVRELGIDAIVDLAGYVANPYPCIARASVFVLSSRSEGFGNVLVEAMALGVPIVSTDCPHGPGEILDRGRYGVLVPAGDPSALAAAIDRLLADPAAARALAAAGPARAAAFTAERSGSTYVAMLEELLSRRRG